MTISRPLFPRYLGADFEALPPSVREGHRVQDRLTLAGRARVDRGGALWARVIAFVFGFPKAAPDVPVTVTMQARDGAEVWDRSFAGKLFRSVLRIEGARMTERFGPLTFTLDLHVADGCLHFPVVAARCGPVPLPAVLLPQSVAREYEDDGRFHFDVAIHAPVTKTLVVHYRGWLVPAQVAPK